MRILMVGVVAGAILIANTAHADFKVQPGLLPAAQKAPTPPAAALPAPSAATPAAPALQVKQEVKAVEPAQPKRPPPVERKEPVWVVKPGSRLRPVLEEFTRRAGWHLEMNFKDPITQQDADLVLGGGLHVQGDFKAAIRGIWDSLDTDKIEAEFWSENEPKTLYVFRKGMGK